MDKAKKKDDVFEGIVEHNFSTVVTKISTETISAIPEFLDAKSFKEEVVVGNAPISVQTTNYSNFESKQLESLLKIREQKQKDKSEGKYSSDK